MLGLAAVLILHCRPTGSNPFHPSFLGVDDERLEAEN
jgi:hypothetical protein